MKNFGDLMVEASRKKESALIVGLDPLLENFPQGLAPNKGLSIGESIFEFNKLVIDLIHPHVVAVKPQLAFYELYGSEGIKALEKSINHAKNKGLIIVNDAKRGDIASTAEAYAEAFLGDSPMSGDAVTVNPFLGKDGILPFVHKEGKGLFILLKTSNPTSSEIQDLILENGDPLYLQIAKNIKELSKGTIGEYGFSNIGVVIGATFPEVSKNLRNDLPETLFLVPGYGAQGGSLKGLKNFFNKSGDGAFINSSRRILYSYKRSFPDNWRELDIDSIKEEILTAVINTKREINEVR